MMGLYSSSAVKLTTAALTATIPAVYSFAPTTFDDYTPRMAKVSYSEETGIPKLIAYYGKKDNLIIEAQELFPSLRDFTEEESIAYEASLDKLFTSTGENFFDLC